MSKISEHIEPGLMLEALENGEIWFADHLSKCHACNVMFKLLKGEDVIAGDINKPEKNLIHRFSLIPFLSQIGDNIKTEFGHLTFDSWSTLPALQVRDTGPGMMRHVRFRFGKIKVEMVAERQQLLWQFTAKVYELERTAFNWILSTCGKKLLPGRTGFYQWTSKRKPQKIKLYNQSMQVDLEKLSWIK